MIRIDAELERGGWKSRMVVAGARRTGVRVAGRGTRGAAGAGEEGDGGRSPVGKCRWWWTPARAQTGGTRSNQHGSAGVRIIGQIETLPVAVGGGAVPVRRRRVSGREWASIDITPKENIWLSGLRRADTRVGRSADSDSRQGAGGERRQEQGGDRHRGPGGCDADAGGLGGRPGDEDVRCAAVEPDDQTFPTRTRDRRCGRT